MTIFPSTANDTEKQYVCLTLEVTLPELYPDCEPKIELKNPRGLDDSVFDSLYTALKNKCLEYTGQPVIYELIEVSGKDYFNQILVIDYYIKEICFSQMHLPIITILDAKKEWPRSLFDRGIQGDLVWMVENDGRD